MNPLIPKVPNILTGRERYRDAAARSTTRTALGLGTSDNPTFASVSAGSFASNYYYGSYSYINSLSTLIRCSLPTIILHI